MRYTNTNAGNTTEPDGHNPVHAQEREEYLGKLLARVQAHIYDVENPKPTSIYYSLRDNWQDDFDEWLNSNTENSTFSQIVLSEISRKNMNSVDFYRKAGLDRKLFSRMANDAQYQPSKRTAIMCCLALELDTRQTAHVLELAGYALSRTLHADLAVRYCIQHGIYKVMDVLEVMERVQASDRGER